MVQCCSMHLVLHVTRFKMDLPTSLESSEAFYESTTLRMMCSSLNDHLYSKLYFINDYHCPCGSNVKQLNTLYRFPFVSCNRKCLTNSRFLIFAHLSITLGMVLVTKMDLNQQAIDSIQKFLRNSGRLGCANRLISLTERFNYPCLAIYTSLF